MKDLGARQRSDPLACKNLACRCWDPFWDCGSSLAGPDTFNQVCKDSRFEIRGIGKLQTR